MSPVTDPLLPGLVIAAAVVALIGLALVVVGVYYARPPADAYDVFGDGDEEHAPGVESVLATVGFQRVHHAGPERFYTRWLRLTARPASARFVLAPHMVGDPGGESEAGEVESPDPTPDVPLDPDPLTGPLSVLTGVTLLLPGAPPALADDVMRTGMTDYSRRDAAALLALLDEDEEAA